MKPVLRRSTVTHVALAAAGLVAVACGGAMEMPTQGSSGGATAASSGGAANAGATVAAVGGATATPTTGGSTATMPTCPTAEFVAGRLLCGVTRAGAPIARNVACTAEDPQLCFKPCGPQGIGFKSETCTAGFYVEDPYCQFDPACDYSCYRLPEWPDPACPANEVDAPGHGMPCSLPPCVVCGGTSREQTTGYRNSAGLLKVGYCECRSAVAGADGTIAAAPKWSCAAILTNWPCPGNPGC